MIDLLPAELRRQTGRRGSFYGSMGACALFALIVLLWAALTKDQPYRFEIVNNGAGLVSAVAVICAVVIGAIAGAYDTDQGTMRYLVLTGRPRWQLLLVRYLALIGTIILVTLPALLLVFVGQLLGRAGVPLGVTDRTGGAANFQLFYGVWMAGVLYGVLALSIGTFLKSNGVAIAVAIVLNFAGVLAAGLLWEFVSHTLGDMFYPVVAGVVIDRSVQSGGSDIDASTFSMGGSIAMLVVWLALLFGLSFWRVQRSEY